jgi:hypothetical protein
MASGFAAFFVFCFFFLMLASVWRIFEKAGRYGWEAFIPFYNLYALSKILGKSGWWMFLYFIPIVSTVAWVVTAGQISVKFGRGVGFAVGLIFLLPIFLPILAFGDTEYEGRLHDEEEDYAAEERLAASELGLESRYFVNDKGETIETIPVDEWEA